jgi:hypothetical protein
VSGRDFRDIVIEELADSEAALREENRTLIDIIADLAWENYSLRVNFIRILTLADGVRVQAQRQRDAVLERREHNNGRAA